MVAAKGPCMEMKPWGGVMGTSGGLGNRLPVLTFSLGSAPSSVVAKELAVAPSTSSFFWPVAGSWRSGESAGFACGGVWFEIVGLHFFFLPPTFFPAPACKFAAVAAVAFDRFCHVASTEFKPN